MKKFLLIVLFTVSAYSSFATTYYFKPAATDLTSNTNWSPNTDGTGTSPADFSTPTDVFILNVTGKTLSTSWPIQGKLQIGTAASSAIILTISSSGYFTGTTYSIDITDNNNAGNNTLLLQSNTYPKLGTLNATSTVEYAAPNTVNPQFVSNGTYGNLKISGISSFKQINTATATLAINGLLTINDGATLILPSGGSNPTITGTFTTASNAGSTSKLSIATNYFTPIPSNITYNFNVEYNTTGTSNVMGGTYNQALAIIGTSRDYVLCDNTNPIILKGTFTHTATYTAGAQFYPNIGTINFNATTAQTIPALNYYNLTSSSTGARTLASSGTIGIANTFTPGTTNTYTNTGSEINFNGSSSQTIPAFNYNNLTSSSTGARTLASSGTIGVSGTFTPGTNTYTITGSTINFYGTGSQTIPAFNYNNLTSSSSGARVLASSGTIGVAGTFTPFTNTYTLTGSEINFNAAGGQTVPQFQYHNLTLSNSGSKAMSGTVSFDASAKLSIQGSADNAFGNLPTYNSTTTLEFKNAGTRSRSSIQAGYALRAAPGVTQLIIDGSTLNIDDLAPVSPSWTLTESRYLSTNLQIINSGVVNVNDSCRLDLFADLVTNTGGYLTGVATSRIHISGANTQNIGKINTSGYVCFDKYNGTATFNDNLNAQDLYVWNPNDAAVPTGGTYSFNTAASITSGTLTMGQSATGTPPLSAAQTPGTGVSNGTLILNNTALATGATHSHTITGNATILDGTIDFSSATIADKLSSILNIAGNFTKTGGYFKTSSVIGGIGNFGLVNFNGTTQTIKCTTAYTSNLQCTYYVASGSTCTLSSGYNFNLGPVSTYESFNILSGGTLVCGATDVVSNNGPGYFTLSGGGTLKTANVNGINSSGATGSIQTGTRYFDSGGNLEYNGTAAQNTGVFTTSPTALTVNNLTINNTPASTGIVTGQQDFTVNGVFAQTAGIFAIGGTVGTPQTLTLNGTLTNAAPSTNTLRANGYSNLTVGSTGTGAGALGNSLYFDNTVATAGKSSGADADGLGGNLTPGTTNNIKNFLFNRSGQTITLGNIMQVNNTVTPTAGTLASGGNLVMLSTNSITSSILAFPASGASITGNVIVQSFFKGGTVATNRGFRMISSPIAASNFFQQIKDRFIVTCSSNQNYPSPATGCDFRPVQAPYAQTLVGYIEGLTYVAASFDNTITPMTTFVPSTMVGKGYYFFFRGSRANLNATGSGKINNTLSDPEDWTGAYTGVINSGNVTAGVTKTGTGSFSGICLLGNPYPATLDISTFFTDNVGSTAGQPLSNYISILNPLRTGFYTASSGVTNGNLGTPISGSGGPFNLQFIQPGQGFFVKANNAGTVTFKETQKASASNSPTAIRLLDAKQGGILDGTLATKTTPRKLIRINLQNGVTREDATIVLEKGNDASFGGDDAIYFNNNDLLCNTLTADGKPTCINFMPEVNQVSRISLLANSTTTNANLQLNFSELSGLGDSQMLLVDSFTHTTTRISDANKTYVFGIDRNVAKSYDANRFALEFYSADELPMKIGTFSAKTTNEGVRMDWNTFSEHNSRETVVERSVDGVNFYPIGNIAAAGNSSAEIKYTYTDANPMNGTIYYRLKKVDTEGNFTNSATKSVYFGLDTENAMTLYPNPVVDKVSVRWETNQPVDITVYDMTGKTLRSFANVASGNFNADLTGLATGVYTLVLSDHNGGKRIASKRFVKK